MMDSVEALMENENNSNLESESGIRDRWRDDAFPVVTSVVGGIAAAFTLNDGLASSDVTTGVFTNKSTNEMEEVLEREKPVEAEQLEDTAKSALISDNRGHVSNYDGCISEDISCHEEEKLSRHSDNFGPKYADEIVIDRQNNKEPAIYGSQEEDSDIFFSHSESQTTHEMQQMDVDMSESSCQSSQIKSKNLNVVANTIVDSKNSGKNVNMCDNNQHDPSKEGLAASEYWDDDIDLLEENSQDFINPKDKTVSLDILTGSKAVQNNTYEPDAFGVSSHIVETVNNDNLTEALVEFGEQGIMKAEKRGILPELTSSAESRNMNETKKDHNGSGVMSKSFLAQPQSHRQDCETEENVEDVLFEESVNRVEKQNETLEFCTKAEVTPGHSVHGDLIKRTISVVSKDMDVEEKVQEARADSYHEEESRTSRGQSILENSIISNVSAQFVEADNLSDDTLKVSSANRTVSQCTFSSEFSKQTSEDDVNKNCAQRDDIMISTKEVVVKKPTRSPSENSSVIIGLTGTIMPQSSIKNIANLPLDKMVLCAAVSDPATSAREENKTSATVGSCESDDGKPRTNKSAENIAPEACKSAQSTEFDLGMETEDTLITSAVIDNSGQIGSLKSNCSLSNTTTLTKNFGVRDHRDESNHNRMKISEIKKEHNVYETDIQKVAPDPKNQVSLGVKQEPCTETEEDSDEGVIVIDDEGEFVPVKKEIVQPKAAKNGLGIQITAVSGQQHQLHAGTEQNSDVSAAAGNKKDSSQSKPVKSKLQNCLVCQKVCRCKYNIIRNGDIQHLCDDSCFKQFRKNPTAFLKPKDNSDTTSASLKNTPSTSQLKDVTSSLLGSRKENPSKACAVCQLMDINSAQTFCNWKGLDFCGESCLGKFQASVNSDCSFCHAYIPLAMRTAFCLKIGNDVHPFCQQRCHNEFKKKLRLCSFCQKDVTAVPGAFTALVGTDGKFKEFCSQTCMKKLESQVNDVEVLSVDKGNSQLETITCSVCEKRGEMKYTARFQNKVNKLCSDLCLSAFQYSNKITLSRCDSCGTVCTAEANQAHCVQFEGKVKRFCSDICVSVFCKTNNKAMPCGWCGTLKTNFDMIERLDAENKFQMFCSLNCLSLYRVNLQAKSNQAISCDHCRKVVPAQYHLTMSDASVRNFCSYTCVMTFQAQFAVKQASAGFESTSSPSGTSSTQFQTQQQGTSVQQIQQQNQQQSTPATRGGHGRMTTRQASAARQQSPTFPVISNVISLAQQEGDPPTQSLQVPAAAPPPVAATPETGTTNNMLASGDGKHQIIIQAAPPKYGKNKSLQCRPITQTKATSCRPHSQNKEVQTDEIPPQSVLVPVPVPIYIPMPTVMFSAPAPKLVPVPIPIPVPVFIPTTKKSIIGICKTIQEIVERIPADPLEAELLMMAEAVAADKDSADSDSDTEVDTEVDVEDFGIQLVSGAISPAINVNESPTVNEKEDSREENVLQVALRMAEEISGPIQDLETSVEPVAVSKEPSTQQQKPAPEEINLEDIDDDHDADYIPPQATRKRARKRQNKGRPPPSPRPKRQRLGISYTEDESVQPELSEQPQPAEAVPDANYHLKFTYGLNAWRHWVIGKNLEIDKSRSLGNVRARQFPTDILKCTTEELNMSLCMFITEVRKPNGEEYSADSIYYLCLGLQQFLYENGRIDSIFTDSYFEKFTESLNESLKIFQPKLNSQGQMLCRIEEEHLWESKQLGAHSPYVLLNTLIYFHTKYFILKTPQEHMSLSFAQILKHWKKGMPIKGAAATSPATAATAKNVSLRFYCVTNGKKDMARKGKEGVPVYEVTENFDNPLRCPVKLYEFFLSKCPESIKNRNDIFYPVPERSCVPDSPVWYSTASIDIHTLDKMLRRVLLVREIQEAILHAQPLYL